MVEGGCKDYVCAYINCSKKLTSFARKGVVVVLGFKADCLSKDLGL